MRAVILLLVAALAACSNSTAPKGLDPTVLIINQTVGDTVYFTWRDGQGVVGSDTVLGGQTACEQFTARPDSAYFQLVATHWYAGTPPVPSTSILTAPWFNPTDLEYVTVRVTWTGGSPSIFEASDSTAPC